MIAIILSCLKIHWRTTVITAFFLWIFATVSVQHLELKHARDKLSTCHAENTTLENSNKALLDSLTHQNVAIEAIRVEQKKVRSRSLRALEAAHADVSKDGIIAKSILAKKSSGDACGDMRALINAYVGK